MLTEVATNFDIDASLKHVLAIITDSFDQDVSRFISNVDKSDSRIMTTLQAAATVKFHSQLDRLIYRVIFSHAMAAEIKSPGSFREFISSLIDDVKHVDADHVDGSSYYADASDVRRIIDDTSGDISHLIKEMMLSTLTLAGHDGKIIIEKTSSNVPSIELINGNTFDVKPAFFISTKLINPRVVIVDGYIESVAEINRFLTDASETHDHVAMFVRGAHPDVISTLKVNFDRGSLRIVPFIVELDINGINTLKDIAVLSGNDVISSAKGELIVSMKLSDQKRVSSMIINRDDVILQVNETLGLKNHVAFLKKMHSEVEENVAKLYVDRIKSLTSRHVVVRLPDDMKYVMNAQAFDRVLRTFKSLVEGGKTTDDKLSISVAISRLYVKNCLNALRSLGAVVYDVTS